jgi:hypothetical protein
MAVGIPPYAKTRHEGLGEPQRSALDSKECEDEQTVVRVIAGRSTQVDTGVNESRNVAGCDV